LLAATSFGHLTTAEIVNQPSPGVFIPYKPITGTIFDLLDANHVTWRDYFSDFPESIIFRSIPSLFAKGQIQPLTKFFADVAAGTLPQISYVESAAGGIAPGVAENDEHPRATSARVSCMFRKWSTRYGIVRAGRTRCSSSLTMSTEATTITR
jgi:hypothetical protein